MIRLLPSYPDWTAVITGRTTSDNLGFERELKSKVADAGLSGRILFIGDVDDIAVWYRRFTLFVAPSRQEGFGLTPLEAMASATAVVASDAGSFPSMIKPGINGAIVPAGDLNALAAAIEPYFLKPDLAKAKQVFAAFSIYADVSKLGDRLAQFAPTAVVLALVLALGNYVIRFSRWQIYLRVVGVSVGPAPEYSLGVRSQRRNPPITIEQHPVARALMLPRLIM